MVDARPDTTKSWGVHLRGISALLKRLPLPRNPEFDVRAQLWFYFAVIANYFKVGGAFPAELTNWSRERSDLVTNTTEPSCELIDILIGIVRFCANIQRYRAFSALYKALDLELALQTWIERLPPQWSFASQQSDTANTVGTFYGRYHVYHDEWTARILNHYYLGRLLVNEIILAYASQLGECTAEWFQQKQYSLTVVSEMATEICTGVATQGFFAEPGNGSFSGTRLLMKGVFMTIFPLTVAASATGVPDKLRDWVIERLRMMGNRTGIGQALDAISRIQNAAANQAQGGLAPTCQSLARSVDDRYHPKSVGFVVPSSG